MIDGSESTSRRFFLPFETENIKEAKIPLPQKERIGDPATNKLLVQALRYSMLHGAAPLLSLQKSGVIPTHYQLVPVVMALNKSNRVRMLIADDVGLGKTIEAGLITTELISRNLASRILIICPQNLREQWREALQYFFQVDAKIISSVHRRILERRLPPGSSPWEFYRSLIASIDYVKSDPVKHQVLSVPWDLVIVDEAHQAAKPHQTGEKQNVSMERYNFVLEIAQHTKHLLLLTATPHNGYTDTYASLLRMLDCGIVTGSANSPQIHREVAKDHVCQRRRKDVEEWFKTQTSEKSPFPERVQKEVPIELSHDEEKETLKELEKYGSEILTLANREVNIEIKTSARWAVMHLHKRALSSPKSLRESLKNRRKRIIEKISGKEASTAQNIAPAQVKATALDEDHSDELSDEEASKRTDAYVFGSLAALQNEKEVLDHLITLAEKVKPSKDSKLKKLTGVDGILDNAMSGVYGPAKVIIFTRYKDTLDYLEQEIPKRMKTVPVEKIVTVYGDLNEKQREERLATFQQLEKGVLIGTDCISEGINLQNMANQIIHYELPWNPNRLEQRNGRVDRYGQKVPVVHIRTLVMQDTLDATILKVLIEKARKIREEYGFSPPFFGDDTNVIQIIQDMGVTLDMPPSQRTIFDFNRGVNSGTNKTAHLNPFDDAVIKQIKSESFYGQTDVDLIDIRNRLKETEDVIGTPLEFQGFVRTGIERFGGTVTENRDVHGSVKIILSESLRVAGYKEVIERATFNPEIALQNTGIVQINVGHPIVRRLIDLIKQSVFDQTSVNYGRTAAVSTPDVARVTALYHFLVRFTVGTKPVTIIEELIPVACDLIDGATLPAEKITALSKARLVPMQRSHDDILRHLSLAMEVSRYSGAFEATVAQHLAAIKRDRTELRQRLVQEQGSQQWLDGIDTVERASADLVSVRIYEPGSSVEEKR